MKKKYLYRILREIFFTVILLCNFSLLWRTRSALPWPAPCPLVHLGYSSWRPPKFNVLWTLKMCAVRWQNMCSVCAVYPIYNYGKTLLGSFAPVATKTFSSDYSNCIQRLRFGAALFQSFISEAIKLLYAAVTFALELKSIITL